ncbi:MAG: CHAT domain-containing protein [Bacteroidota bacterium]|nr:CHAT domain-containing protein [Bacteroidota bacterium]
MNQLLKYLLLIIPLYTIGLPGTQHTAIGQTSSLHDSLRQMLSYFGTNAKDEKLKQAVKEAQINYTSDAINDSLARKLLYADSLLLTDSAQIHHPMTLSYTQTLVMVLRQLPPPQEHPLYPTSLVYLGNLYRKMREPNKALALYHEALAIRKKVLGEKHPDYARSIISIGSLYRQMRAYDSAMAYLQQALAIRKKVLGEEHPDYAQSLIYLGNLYIEMIKYDKALPYFQEALAIRKKVLGEEHPDYARSLISIGNLYKQRGENEKALPYFQELLAIRKKVLGEEHKDYALSLTFLALSYHQIGKYDKALPLYQEALTILKKVLGEEHEDYAYTLNFLGTLYQNMGEYNEAMHYLQQALVIREKVLGKNSEFYGHTLKQIAILYHDMGEYDKALPLYKQSLEIIRNTAGEENPSSAYILNRLGVLYNDMGELDKALSYNQQALDIRKRLFGEEHEEYAGSLNDMALLYYKINEYDSAVLYSEKALNIRKNVLGEGHPAYINSLNGLGQVYSAKGNAPAAALLFIQASAAKLKFLTSTYSALSEQEKMNCLRTEAAQFSYLPSLLFTQKSLQPSSLRQLYTHELTLKGMILEDQHKVLSSIRKSTDSTAMQLYEQWRSNKDFLGKQLLLPIKQRASDLDSLEEVTNQLEQQLSRSSTAFRSQQQSQSITLKDIAEKLSTGRAAIEFIRFPFFNRKWTDSTLYAALVLLPQDSVPRFIPLFEEKQLQHLLASYTIEQLYSDIKGGGATNNTSGSAGDSLYQLIWQPLESCLKDVHTIYYAPVGLLHRIAFQALRFDSTRYLIDKYQVNQVLSTRTVAVPSELAPKPLSASVWGNIEYDLQYSMNKSLASGRGIRGHSVTDTSVSFFNFYNKDTRGLRGRGWDRLVFTSQEIDSLKKLFKKENISVTTLSGTIATEEAFKALDGKSPQVLHLATHGFSIPIKEQKTKDKDGDNNSFTVQQNPMFRSGLVLAGGNHAWVGKPAIPGREDGILTAYEIAQMDLSNTDLVVLSACETALGDVQGNEGVIGLQRAFKMAGVKQMIVSLWSVYDEPTMELITLFYRNWLGGQSTREALRNAQLKMKEKYSDPYYWAGFVVIE